VDISRQRARQLRASDFNDFDWLLCADEQNLRDVLRLSPAASRPRVALLMEWAGVEAGAAIPDPYTGGAREFEQVWRLVDSAAQAVVARLCTAQD
jgi:protein-tyrosine phosphatase